MQWVIRILVAVGEHQRQITGDGFIDPLIAIAGPTHDVAPPLMGHFVKGHELREMLLARGGKSRLALRFRGEIGIGREVQQTGPTLPEASRNLRDAQRVKRKRPAECFVKVNGIRDFVAKIF